MATLPEIYNKKKQAILKELYNNRNRIMGVMEKAEQLRCMHADLQQKENDLLQKLSELQKDIPMSMVKKTAKKPVKSYPKLYEPAPSKEYSKDLFDVLTSV